MNLLLFLAVTVTVFLLVHPWQVAALVVALAGLAVLTLAPAKKDTNTDR